MFARVAPYYEGPFQLVQLLALCAILVSLPPSTFSAWYQYCNGCQCYMTYVPDYQLYPSQNQYSNPYGTGNGYGSNYHPRPEVNLNRPSSGGSYDAQTQCGYLRGGSPSRRRRSVTPRGSSRGSSLVRTRPSPYTVSEAVRKKVIHGTAAQAGRWPWMAAIGSRTNSQRITWFCGGTLISPYYVITAAHCFDKKLPRIFVRLGGHKIDDNFQSSPSAMDIMVNEVMKHSQYYTESNGGIVYNDVALLRFDSAVPLSDSIQPICLAPPDLDQAGVTALIAGWGRTTENGPISTSLLEASVPIVEASKCRQSYGPRIDSRFLCAGGNGKDTCQGDSGGPLVTERNSRYYIIGIVSFGRSCGDPDSPGVYTRISQFTNWIGNPWSGYTSWKP